MAASLFLFHERFRGIDPHSSLTCRFLLRLFLCVAVLFVGCVCVCVCVESTRMAWRKLREFTSVCLSASSKIQVTNREKKKKKKEKNECCRRCSIPFLTSGLFEGLLLKCRALRALMFACSFLSGWQLLCLSVVAVFAGVSRRFSLFSFPTIGRLLKKKRVCFARQIVRRRSDSQRTATACLHGHTSVQLLCAR